MPCASSMHCPGRHANPPGLRTALCPPRPRAPPPARPRPCPRRCCWPPRTWAAAPAGPASRASAAPQRAQASSSTRSGARAGAGVQHGCCHNAAERPTHHHSASCRGCCMLLPVLCLLVHRRTSTRVTPRRLSGCRPAACPLRGQGQGQLQAGASTTLDLSQKQELPPGMTQLPGAVRPGLHAAHAAVRLPDAGWGAGARRLMCSMNGVQGAAGRQAVPHWRRAGTMATWGRSEMAWQAAAH